MLSSVTTSWPDTYSAQFFGTLAADDESTPPAEPLPDPRVDAGLVAQPGVGGGECPDVEALAHLRWGVCADHDGHMSNGYHVLLSLCHAHGGLSGCLDNADRMEAYDSLCFWASRAIGAGC